VTTPDPRPAGTPSDPFADPAGGNVPTSGGPAGAGYPPGGTPQVSTPPVSGPPASTPPARHTGRTIGRTLAAALLVFVTVLLVLFVMFNTQTVDISLVFTDVKAPLVVALLVAAALGGLVVALASLLRRARRTR
jgi:uncharacterized integral membrane protein